MCAVRALTTADIGWAVDVLAARRALLVPHAPTYWRPAPDAAARHADYLAFLVGDGGGVGFRTDDGLMIATPGHDDWSIDDAWVPDGQWEADGVALWEATTDRLLGAPVRFVCPAFEPFRAAFARARGLTVSSSWWHRDVPTDQNLVPATVPGRVGATVRFVAAPPVYDPGGPITFLQDVSDHADLDDAAHQASRTGSPLVVVEQPALDQGLGVALAERGYVRHCDFFTRSD